MKGKYNGYAMQVIAKEPEANEIFNRNGKTAVIKTAATLHTPKSIKLVFKYLLTDKAFIDAGRGDEIHFNGKVFVSPNRFKGTPLYKQVLNETIDLMTQAFTDHLDKHATKSDREKIDSVASMLGNTDEEKRKIMTAYYTYNYILSFNFDEEVISKKEQSKLMKEVSDYFFKRITYSKNENEHIKSEILHTDNGHPHLHCMISRHNNKSKKLNLDNMHYRMMFTIAELETIHPKFKNLLDKTVSRAIEENMMPKSLEQKEELESLIDKIIDNKLDKEAIRQMLADNGIELIQHMHENKLTHALLKFQGNTISYNNLDKKSKVKIQQFIEVKNQDKASTLNFEELMETAKSITNDKTLNSYKEISAAFESKGLYLIPNINKKEALNGFTVFVPSLNQKFKLSTLQLTAKDLKVDITKIEDLKLLKKQKVVNSKIMHTDLKTGQKVEVYQGSGEIMMIDSLGNHRPLYKKRKKLSDYPTLLEYMNDKDKFDISLKRMNYSESSNSFTNNRGQKLIQIVEMDVKNNVLTAAISSPTPKNDKHTAKITVQLYLEAGFKGIEITKMGSLTLAREIWLEARLQGLEMNGYQPTPADLKELAIEQQKRVLECRQKNLEAMLAYKATGAAFDIKTVSNAYSKDIDRSPIAYALIDLIKNDLDPMLLMNPPKKFSGNKADSKDIIKYEKLILDIAQREIPSKIEQIKKIKLK